MEKLREMTRDEVRDLDGKEVVKVFSNFDEKMKKKNESHILELHCPICGKLFVPAPLHIYRDKTVYNERMVCSYKCMLESERMKEAAKQSGKGKAEKRKA